MFFFAGTAVPYSMNYPTDTSCVNWNQYYTNCTQLGGNPFQGTISFDNIGLAWVAIFLVIITVIKLSVRGRKIEKLSLKLMKKFSFSFHLNAGRKLKNKSS